MLRSHDEGDRLVQLGFKYGHAHPDSDTFCTLLSHVLHSDSCPSLLPIHDYVVS